MNIDGADYLQLPGSGRFIQSLREDLSQGRSLLLLLPSRLNVGLLWSALRDELWRREYHVREVSLSEPASGVPPVMALAEALDVAWPAAETPRTVENFFRCKGLPDVIWLDGLERLGEAQGKRWCDLLTQWAQTAQGAGDDRWKPPVLCIIAAASPLLPFLPRTNVKLSVRWWWGVVSSLELRLLCRLSEAETGPLTLWREHLLAALASDDLDLAAFLWEDVRSEEEQIAARLRAYAAERGWTRSGLLEAGADELVCAHMGYGTVPDGDNLAQPPERLRALWASGALQWTAEYGLEFHAAALAALGKDEQLKHRMWRGQAAFLLPIIDAVRLKVCGHLNQTYGREWPVKWCRPESAEEAQNATSDPFACQLGYLKTLLQNCSALRAESRWVPLVRRSHWIRNELAHYRSIGFASFEALNREMVKAGVRL